MKSSVRPGAAFMDGRTYSIGRNGQIRVDDTAASRVHAEIRFTQGKIFLRDLNSTNGTYLTRGKNAGRFRAGFVSPHQRVMIGSQIYSIKSLLARVGVYTGYTPATGLIVKLTRPQRILGAWQLAEKSPEDQTRPEAVT